MNPKVSVIMPIYNVEKYLQQSLLSVIHQTMRDIEILCINDGSTDSSGKILEYYSEKDSRIRIVTTPNKGYGHAMNIGLREAKGEYIGIVEPDDYVDTRMFEYLYDMAKIQGADIVKADFYRFTTPLNGKMIKYYQSVVDEDTYYNRLLHPEEYKKIFRFVMNIWCGIYKRKLIIDNNIYFNESAGAAFQDNGFWFQTLCFCKAIYFVKIPFYMNRRDNVNSSVNNLGNLYAINNEFQYIKRFLLSRPELKDIYLVGYQIKKYQTYKFNISRCPGYLLDEYITTISKEWKKDCETGDLKPDFFREDEWKEISMIKNTPDIYISQIEKGRVEDNNTTDLKLYQEGTAEYELNEIKKSFSYKIGLFITKIPRKIKSLQEKKNGKKEV